MGFAKLELVQKDSGEIVLQAEDGEEPLLELRFNRKLTEMLGADALDLAQAMVESAGYAFEYAQESAETRRAGALRDLAEDPDADGAKAMEEQASAMIRLRTTPLH